MGELMFSNAKAGAAVEVTCKLQRPTTGSDKESAKTALVTRVSDQICGVCGIGYYRPE